MRLRLSLLTLLLLTACSINVSDGPAATVPVIPTKTDLPALTAPHAETATPSAEVTALPWAALNLTGKLLYTQGPQGVAKFDLATGQITTLFRPPAKAWLTAASASPDGQWLALAYAPPPPDGQPQLGYTDLYLISATCDTTTDGCANNTPQPLLQRAQNSEAYFAPIWTPDGQSLYYTHFTPSDANNQSPFKYTLERVTVTAGQVAGRPETLIEHAIWPRLSNDGQQIVYVYQDPDTYRNELFIADADGQNARRLLDPATFDAVDAPIFAPDGQTLIISAVGEGPQSAAQWLQTRLAAPSAEAAPAPDGLFLPSAHNVPSDWWRVEIATGALTRLTRLYDMGLYGDYAPDRQFVGFVSATGLWVMSPDGSNLTQLQPGQTNIGTFEWIR
jgi:Tol biopolymer transport system component